MTKKEQSSPAVPPQSAVCDTARSPAVTPSRGYRTYQPDLLPHEETLVMWWRSGNRIDTEDQWMNISHRCSGASSAAADFLQQRGLLAAADFSTCSVLAIERAFLSPVTLAGSALVTGGGSMNIDDLCRNERRAWATWSDHLARCASCQRVHAIHGHADVGCSAGADAYGAWRISASQHMVALNPSYSQ